VSEDISSGRGIIKYSSTLAVKFKVKLKASSKALIFTRPSRWATTVT